MDGPSCSKLTKRYASEPATKDAAKRRRHMKEFQPDVTHVTTHPLVANMPLPSMPDLDDATPLAQQQSKRQNKSKHKKSKKSKKHAKHDEDMHRHHQRHHRHHRRSEQLQQNPAEQLTAQPQSADSEDNANVSLLEKMLQQQSLCVKTQLGSSHKRTSSTAKANSTVTGATTATRNTTPSHWYGKKKHILEQWRREQLHYTDSD